MSTRSAKSQVLDRQPLVPPLWPELAAAVHAETHRSAAPVAVAILEFPPPAKDSGSPPNRTNSSASRVSIYLCLGLAIYICTTSNAIIHVGLYRCSYMFCVHVSIKNVHKDHDMI